MPDNFERVVFGLIALAVSAFCLTACLTQTVASQCEEVVERQCEECFACAQGDDDTTGADICGLIDAETESECRTELQSQCEQQSRLLRDPYDDLENCSSSLEQVTCDQRFDWYALDQNRSPASCAAFLY